MSDYLSDADYEEHIRCAALGMESPFKGARYEQLVGWVDMDRKRRKEGTLSEGTQIGTAKEAGRGSASEVPVPSESVAVEGHERKP